MTFKTCVAFSCNSLRCSLNLRLFTWVENNLQSELCISKVGKSLSFSKQSCEYESSLKMISKNSLKLSEEFVSTPTVDLERCYHNQVTLSHNTNSIHSSKDIEISPCYSLEDISSPSQSPPSKKLLMSTLDELFKDKYPIDSVEKMLSHHSERQDSSNKDENCEMTSDLPTVHSCNVERTDLTINRQITSESSVVDETSGNSAAKCKASLKPPQIVTVPKDTCLKIDVLNRDMKTKEEERFTLKTQAETSNTVMEITNFQNKDINNSKTEKALETETGKGGNSLTNISVRDIDKTLCDFVSSKDNHIGNDKEEVSVLKPGLNNTIKSENEETDNKSKAESELSLLPFANDSLSEMESEDEFQDVFSLKKLFTGKLSYSGDNKKKKSNLKSSGSTGRSRPNYFVAVQISDPKIHSEIKLIQDDIVTREPLLKQALIDVNTLHVTLLVLHLANNEDIERASEVLQSCYKKIEEITSTPLTLQFEGLGHFQNQVLFAKIKCGDGLTRLETIANTLEELFKTSGMVTDSKSFKPHLTILKLSKAPKLFKKGIKKIKPSMYVEHIEKIFGSQLIQSLQLLSMTKPKDEKGYYQCSKEIAINLIQSHRNENKEIDIPCDKPWKLQQQQHLLKKNLRLAKLNIRQTIHTLTKVQLAKSLEVNFSTEKDQSIKVEESATNEMKQSDIQSEESETKQCKKENNDDTSSVTPEDTQNEATL